MTRLITAWENMVKNWSRSGLESWPIVTPELWQKVAQRLAADLENEDYDQAFSTVAELKSNVDTFFDEVMVMVDDQAVRENRLALLQGIAADFKKIADFSKL